MFNSRMEQIASAAGHLFFLAAIVLFIMLILSAGGVVTAQEPPFTDALEPDALDEDALEPDALEEDALGVERVDPRSTLIPVDPADLPLAEIPPRPGVAIAPPPWFCVHCWEWHIHGCPRGFPGSRWEPGGVIEWHPAPNPVPAGPHWPASGDGCRPGSAPSETASPVDETERKQIGRGGKPT